MSRAPAAAARQQDEAGDRRADAWLATTDGTWERAARERAGPAARRPLAAGQAIVVSRPGGRVPQGERTAVVVVAGFGTSAVADRVTVGVVAEAGGDGYHEIRPGLPGGLCGVRRVAGRSKMPHFVQRSRRLTLGFGLALVVWVAASSPADAQSAVILVRHAEKAAAPANDPPLTPAGLARAQALAEALAETRVDAVISTQYRRTRETAAPVAAARGLDPQIVATGGDTAAHVQAVAAAVKARGAGEVVLVVGHSNTVPAIITALGGPAMPALCDPEYANLFVLVPSPSGWRLIRGHYGAPDPPTAADCNRAVVRK